MTEKLLQGLLKLDFTQEQCSTLVPKMEKYTDEIILFNSAYNLTNTSDFDEIAVNHILDSLSGTKIIKKLAESIVLKGTELSELKIADIGSGGGLPGIPLAAAMPQFNFTLVERMDKRCAFLENCAAILGLKNVTVLKSEAEKVRAESFHIATFRAFRPLDKKMTKTLLALTKKGGFLTAYKARFSNITEEMNSIKELVEKYSVEPLSVPFLTDSASKKESRERNLVIIPVN